MFGLHYKGTVYCVLVYTNTQLESACLCGANATAGNNISNVVISLTAVELYTHRDISE